VHPLEHLRQPGALVLLVAVDGGDGERPGVAAVVLEGALEAFCRRSASSASPVAAARNWNESRTSSSLKARFWPAAIASFTFAIVAS
jgi:hypothetical protein